MRHRGQLSLRSPPPRATDGVQLAAARAQMEITQRTRRDPAVSFTSRAEDSGAEQPQVYKFNE